MKQAIISTALELINSAYKDSSGKLILNGNNIMCSCSALIRTINFYFYTSIAYNGLNSNSILKEYREFSGARKCESGFEGVELSEDTAQRQAYRQEMLYYFWMANQEM